MYRPLGRGVSSNLFFQHQINKLTQAVQFLFSLSQRPFTAPEILIFGAMQTVNRPVMEIDSISLLSVFLDREVLVDLYYPRGMDYAGDMDLLLINDGQNMEELGLAGMLSDQWSRDGRLNWFTVAVHASAARKMEYGVAGIPDYLGRGALAGAYSSFILTELLPYLYERLGISRFRQSAYAGFSLGGLSALDICWHNPEIFKYAGIFSGSLWWRSLDQKDPAYHDQLHRIMHQVIRHGQPPAGLKFFFQCGNQDETMDRNHNGIIDSIDDTLDMIAELERKGYMRGRDIEYLEMPDGKHDVPTWGRAMPVFLEWISSK